MSNYKKFNENTNDLMLLSVIDSSNNELISANQELVGKNVNPNTKIPPVIANPLSDLNSWRSNNFVNHSHINSESVGDLSLSGYKVSDYCNKNTKSSDYKSDNIGNVNSTGTHNNLEYPYIKENYTNLINKSCGYNPEQISSSNLPCNLSAGNCERNVNMKNYNKNLFTQTIQPDVYTTSEVIEPINSNIGISFTPQLLPTSIQSKDNDITFTEHNPYTFNKVVNNTNDDTKRVTEYNVYDPRFSGYGTSYRAYTHDLTGQTRFMYDDVNAIRMPNYITRSNIDFASYSDKYGPIDLDKSKMNNSQIRHLANNSFLENTLQHRTELQQRLLRKRNSELWQLRKYPSHTNGSKSTASVGLSLQN